MHVEARFHKRALDGDVILVPRSGTTSWPRRGLGAASGGPGSEREPIVSLIVVMLKPRQGRREGTRCRSDLIPPVPLLSPNGGPGTSDFFCRAQPLEHVFVEASTTRRHDEFAALGATLPQLRARKVVCIPLVIPQPDWDDKPPNGWAPRSPSSARALD